MSLTNKRACIIFDTDAQFYFIRPETLLIWGENRRLINRLSLCLNILEIKNFVKYYFCITCMYHFYVLYHVDEIFRYRRLCWHAMFKWRNMHWWDQQLHLRLCPRIYRTDLWHKYMLFLIIKCCCILHF
jgi:hypothetical protein